MRTAPPPLRYRENLETTLFIEHTGNVNPELLADQREPTRVTKVALSDIIQNPLDQYIPLVLLCYKLLANLGLSFRGVNLKV